MKYRTFISSVQREFARERKALADYIRRDALFGRFFEVFIFEETPAASDSAQKVYLGEAKDCDVYLGLIGARYGNVDEKTGLITVVDKQGKVIFTGKMYRGGNQLKGELFGKPITLEGLCGL